MFNWVLMFVVAISAWLFGVNVVIGLYSLITIIALVILFLAWLDEMDNFQWGILLWIFVSSVGFMTFGEGSWKVFIGG